MCLGRERWKVSERSFYDHGSLGLQRGIRADKELQQ